MKKEVFGILAVGLLLAAPALAQDAPTAPAYNCDFQPSCEVAPGAYGKISEPVTSKFKLSIGGFVKLDYAYNSVNLGQSGSLSPGSGAVPKSSSVAGKQDQSIFTARQSRLWFKVAGPSFLGAKTNALVEVDFYGDPSAANEAPQIRMRHAYASMDWAKTSLLFGQTWDIFGPMAANTIDFRQGASFGTPNNPRVPQIRLTHRLDLNPTNSLRLIFGVQDPNQNGNNSGAATAFSNNVGSAVNVAAQAMWVSKALGVSPGFWGLSMNSLTAGVFGLYGNQDARTTTGDKSMDSWGYGAYAFVPIIKSKDGKSRAMTMSFEGQAYMAANMNFTAATSVNFVNTPSTGLPVDPQAAKAYGFAGQLIFFPTQDLGISAGYLRRNAYDNASYRTIASGNYQRYNSNIFANVSYDLNAAIRVAVEYENLNTQYGNVNNGAAPTMDGTADSGSANIVRMALFYFF
jgi:hypothetical protein